jgi:hypothetical protein
MRTEVAAVRWTVDQIDYRIEVLEENLALPPEWWGEVGILIAREELDVLLGERDRRKRARALLGGDASKRDRTRQAWVDLARMVKERVTIPEVLQLAAYPVRQTGANEWHSACPACGEGDDRLVIWTGVKPGAWCRRCENSFDAISLCQSLIPECGEFRDAVRFLARLATLNREAV